MNVNPNRLFPLTQAQRRIWYMEMMHPNTSASTVAGTLYIRGKVDLEVLKQAVYLVIKQHDAFRIQIKSEDNQPMQWFRPEEEVIPEIEYLEWDNFVEAEAWLEQFNLVPTSIFDDKLYHTVIFNINNEEHWFNLKINHIIADGVSSHLIANKIMQNYTAIASHTMPSEDKKSTYFDYIFAEQEYEKSERYMKDRAFWLDKFRTMPEMMGIKPYPPFSIGTEAQRSSYISVAGEQYEQLQRFSEQHNISLFTLFLGALYAVLYKTSGNEDIAIGTAYANRTSKQDKDTLGMFVSTVATRLSIDPDQDLITFLHMVSKEQKSILRHQKYPYNKLILDLREEYNNIDIQDLYRISIDYLPIHWTSYGDLSVRQRSSFCGHEADDFAVHVEDMLDDHQLMISIDYRIQLFEEQEMIRIMEQMLTIVEQVLHNSQQTMRQLSMLNEKESNIILTQFNEPRADYPRDKTVHQLFEEQADRTPDEIAVVYAEQHLTYRELNTRANSLARTLRAQGVTPEQLVGIMVDRSLEMIVGILAILKAGGAYVPIDPEYPEERIRYMLEDSDAHVLVSQGHLHSRVTFTGTWILVDDESSYLADSSNLKPVNEPAHLSYVIYTSGTTGKPKGVMIEHRQLVAMANAWKREYRLNEAGFRLLQWASFSFDVFTGDMVRTLLFGGQLVLCPNEARANPSALCELIGKHHIQMFESTPALVIPLMEHVYENRIDINSLKLLIVGSDHCPTSEFRKLNERFGSQMRILNSYGVTEACVDACYYEQTSSNALSILPIGKPMPAVTMYILDSNQSLQPIGLAGELYIGGAGVGRGYLNQSDLTDEKFVDDPFSPGALMYRTGDLAKWLPDGNIEYLGRIDYQVKIRGYRIEIGEIETQLLKQAHVREAVVIAREDHEGPKELCAYYVADNELTVHELREALAEDLPAYMIPSYFVRMDRLPLTPNGKVDRKGLPAPEGEAHTGSEYVAPRTEAEHTLVNVWQTVLGAQRVSVLDHFFALGGDSIKSIQVASRLQQAGYKLEIRDLFKYPTIAQLAPQMQLIVRRAEQGEVSGSVELTPILRWYFGQNAADMHHYNQSVMLYRENGFDEAALRKALNKLVEHHDALRIVFRRTAEGSCTAWNRSVQEGELFKLDVVDYTSNAGMEQMLAAKAEEIQSSIDLETGPLVRGGLFHCLDGDHLLIVIHHAVIDGVSWRILLEDITAGYEQALQGEVIRLSAKTDSFRTWSKQLVQYADTTDLQQEQQYWRHITQLDVLPLPTDTVETYALQLDSESVTVTWSREQTEQLLKQVHGAYNTQMNDILLAALGLAIHRWSGHDRILVNLEGHGRESILPDIDITRTIGWFTSEYPVVLELLPDTGLGNWIKQTKENLRHIPNNGIGYGICRYMINDVEPLDEWGAAPQISFNYLGQFDQDFQQNGLAMSSYSTGRDISGEQARPYLLDMNGMISDGVLKFDISYGRTQYHCDTMNRLAVLFEESLQEIIAHCAAKERSELTPSDVTLQHISLHELERIIEQTTDIGVVEDIYSLTPMQKGMWFHTALNQQTGAYFELTRFTLQGDLNIGAFADSWNALTARHSVLRTNFQMGSDGEPLQVVFQNKRIGFTFEDLRGMEPEEQAAYMEKAVGRERTRGFDLECGELMRVMVLRTAEHTYQVFWSSHHILMDGWCLPLVAKEVFDTYAAYVWNKQPMLNTAPSYNQYIRWLEQQNEVAAAAYWTAYLAGYDEPVALPQAKAYGQNETYAAGQVVCQLGKDLSAAVNRAATQHQVTLNTLLQAAWGVLLQKYNRTTDVVFGGVVSGRPAELNGIEEMIGLFINTIPVRVRSEANTPFIDVMTQLQEQALTSAKHDYFPLYEIQAQSALKQDMINHIMVFENYPMEQMEQLESLDGKGLKLTDVTVSEQTNYDLNLIIVPGDNIAIRLDYNEHTFDRAAMELLKGHILHVLEQISANPYVTVSELELVTTDEKAEILNVFNDTATAYSREKTIHQLFEERVVQSPNAIAAMFGDEQLTYSQLNSAANRMAHRLRTCGVITGSLVGICAERSFEMLIGLLAILKAGGAYVPIDPAYPQERITTMIEDTAINVLLTQEHLQANLPTQIEILLLNHDVETAADDTAQSNLTSEVTGDDLAYIVYTSGSTGMPKGVCVTHRGVVRLVSSTTYVDINESDVFLQGSTISFDAATFEIWGSLLNGAALAILPAGDLSLTDWTLAMRTHGVSILWLTAGLFQVMVEHQLEGLQGIKQLLVGGDVVSSQHARKVLELYSGIRLINGYGPTENTTFTCCHDITLADLESTSIPIGRPIGSTKVYVLDESGKLLPTGVIGELYTGGDGLARGYLNRPELTAEKFVEVPFLQGERLYRTGDLARWLPDGTIEYMGRSDEQVKIRGFRIELGEVLTHLLKVEAVREAIAVAVEDTSGQKVLCAYFTADDKLAAAELKAVLSEQLPSYMVPSHFVQIEEMPLTPNGKVDRKALPLPEEGLIASEQIQPRTPLEAKLAQLWQDVLGLEHVGITDSFFDIGGHSLRATTLVSKLHQEMNVIMPLRDVFRYSTIEEMAQVISQMEHQAYNTIPLTEMRDWYPVSSAQKRLFILHQMEGAEQSYNMPAVLTMDGVLDRERFAAAFHKLIQRHDTLRTGFEMINGEPVQRIHEHVEIIVDYWQSGEAEAEHIIRQFIRTFALETPPLLRVGLIELAHDRHLLLFDMHHIISDGASIGILLDEFVALYSGEELAPLRIQYKDYAVWQQSASFRSQMEVQRAYWQGALSGELPVLQLSSDFTRPTFRSYEGNTHEFTIDVEKLGQLKQLAAETGTTLYMMLMALYTAMLHKYTSQEDIIVGMPIAGRTHGDVQPLIGMFVNTLAIRNYPAGEKTFMSYLKEVQQTTLQAYEYQDYPFEELVDNIQVTRDVSRNPVFDTVLVLQNTEQGEWAIEGLRVTPQMASHPVAKFDLTLQVEEGEAGLTCSMEYATALYKQDTIARMSQHFSQLIDGVILQPSARLDQLDMVTAQERIQLIEQFNDTDAEYPRDHTIHRLFEEQAERTPDAIAVVAPDATLTYKELNERANRLAWMLRSQGVQADTLVGIMAERTSSMLIGLLAILKAGGAYVPIDPEYPEDRVSYMLEDSGTTVLLLPRHLREQVTYNGTILFLDEEEAYTANNLNLPNINKSSDLAYVIYTSGTTGKPKGTLIEHKNVVRLLFNSRNLFDFGPSDTWTLFHSFCFDFSVWEMYGALLYGGKLVIVPQLTAKNPAAFMELLAEQQVTILNQTPTYFYQLLREALADGSPELKIRQVIFGGEALSPQLLHDWRQKYPHTQLINMYGITETTVHVTYKEITELEIEQAKSNIGFPIPTLKIFVLDASRQCVPIGVAGEMYVAGDGLARGYLHRPELTADRFVDHPWEPDAKMYKTGDLARWLPDGNIEYLGRIDHQVKIRGYRIELGEVEAQLSKLDAVRETIVIAREDAGGDKQLCAYFVADRLLTVGELRSELAEELPAYMIPAYFVQLERMPLTSNGKVDRKALPAPEDSINTGSDYTAPRSPLEAQLADIWQEVLGLAIVGVQDNFFEVGGHSLRATTLINKVHEQLHVNLPLREVFRLPTIEAQAAAIASLYNEQSSYSAIPVAEEQAYYPVSSAQKRLYILHQLEGAEQGYNMPGVMLLEGPLDRDRFEAAFRKLIARHDILRTGFELVHGEPVQRIYGEVEFAIAYMEANDDQVQELSRQFVRTFELEQPPLLRLGLIELTTERHVLLFDMHHIISDGVSMGIVLQEFALLYRDEAVTPLKIQYKDYAVWQQATSQQDRMKEQETYWLEVFHGNLPILELPTDYARPTMQKYDGLTYPFRIDQQQSQALHEIAANTGTTLYMVLLAAYTILLHKYTGQEDIVVGTPIAGRTHVDVQPLIGMFVNTLAIRTNPESHKTFRSYLDEIKDMMLGAYEHQNYPFEQLVENLELTRDLSRNPLFDTMFALDNTDSKDYSLGELRMKPYPQEYKVSKFDLSLDVSTDEQGLDCSMEYATALFASDTVERMAKHFGHLIGAIIDNPEAKLDELGIMTTEEQAAVLSLYDAAAAFPSGDTIHRLFEEQAARTPDQVAVVYENEQLTYQELNERTNRLARSLRHQGLSPDQLVGIMADRSLDMIVGTLAVLKAGGAYVPIDPEYPEDRIRYMLEDANAQILLTQSHLQTKVSHAGAWIMIDQPEFYHEDSSNLELVNVATDLCYVIYTSGTTGNPKGVMIEHRHLVAMSSAWKVEYDLQESGIRWLQWASYSFDVFSGDMARALLHGGELVICPTEARANPADICELIRKHDIQMFESTPALVIPLMEHVYEHQQDISSLKMLIIGSDLCPTQEFQKLLDRFGVQMRIINSYGVTEACVDACYYETSSTASVRALPIGKPLPAVRMYILDAKQAILPLGLTGELYIGGASVGRGYLNRPELSAEKFIEDPFRPGEHMYRTGDLARWLPDGNMELIGRMDHQVKIRGYRIEIGEVESHLLRVGDVREAVVVARDDDSGRKMLCAYYTSDRMLTTGELRDALGQELPGYMIPAHFVQLDRLPLTPNGKIDRKGLPTPEGGAYSGMEYTAPRTAAEKVLANVWQTVLNTERVGIMDHFFELGGDSIKSIQVSSRLHQAGYKLEIRDLFKFPTIAQLSPHLQLLARIADQGEVSGEAELTPIQRWYFELELADPHHYNQAIMLYRADGFDETALRKSLMQLVEHHDALRMVFRKTAQGYVAWNRSIAEGELYSFTVEDFTGEANVEQAIEVRANEIQASMDLQTGPLVKAALFCCAQGHHLLITIHHAVIDGVSWRILLEDLAEGYEQASKGEEIRLPSKTDSYLVWSQQLVSYAASEALNKERLHWEHIVLAAPASLPKDFEAAVSLQQDSESVVVEWNSVETEQLLKQVHRAYNTDMNDILLTALGLALREWSGLERVLVNLEGHGREPIVSDIDVSRTVGWFTSEYPVLLELESDRSLSYLLKKVKEDLRRIPNKGIGYGICRYLAESNSEYEAGPKWGVAPEVSFNYLGQFDQDLQNNGFELSSYASGDYASRKQVRPYLLDINGAIANGALSFDLSYSKHEYRKETVERLAKYLQISLQDIITHCLSQQHAELTPSDVLLQGLSIEDMEQIVADTKHIGEIENMYMLTPMQKGMWFHSVIDGQASAYFEQTRFTLEGELDVDVFINSLEVLANRHSVLRTNFYSWHGEPLQVVFRDRHIEFTHEDMRAYPLAEQVAFMEEIVARDKQRGFNLEQDALVRVTLVQISHTRSHVLWSSHHILMDGWCLPQLTEELFDSYSLFMKQPDSPAASAESNLSPYSQYIEWLAQQDAETAAQYWDDYLAGYDQQTVVPRSSTTDRSGAPYVLAHASANLSAELSSRMQRVAKQHQVTLNTLVQAAWGILLQKYNGTEDVVFGSVVSGRPAEIAGIESMIGLFINTIPVRVSCEADTAFAEVMQQLQEHALESGRYDYYPLYEIQARSTQKQDLVNHIMVFENYPVDERMEQAGDDNDRLTITDVQVAEQTNYDFNLMIVPGETLVVRFDYNSQVYEPASMERLQSHLQHVLEQVTANPRIAVGELELATADEKAELMKSFNDTAADYPQDQTIHRMFEEQTALTPDAIAVMFGEEALTYRELNEQANRLARTLRNIGVVPDQIVGVMADRSLEMMVGIMAVLKAGGAYVPIAPDYPEERIRYMLEDSKAQVLLIQGSSGEGLDFAGRVVQLDDIHMYDADGTNLELINQPQDAAYVIYTSGTTGRPKGVMVEHTSVLNRLLWMQKRYEIGAEDTIMQKTAITFDVSVWELFWWAFVGSKVCLLPVGGEKNPAVILETIERERITTMHFVPSMLHAFLEHVEQLSQTERERSLQPLRQVFTSGEALLASQVERFQRFIAPVNGARLINLYGPTEATVDVTYFDCEAGQPYVSVPIGKPIDNTRIYIVSEQNQLQPIGVAGELCIAGVGLARGYWMRPELTADKFVTLPS
ncbi:non-ribosomal peptide synthase/polyketide synthase, partial [Paenibacillus sp. ACRRX]|uniref:non-ribosomal peptide synthase/polyketide synthase n=1 Tax=Paenibacillus sp. ACRRX TaxID=2918206 RepID=UPI001EF40F0F|nr:non-ribosomal peptide synthase/polyketide synthase [Paenibacillus sp. ACRRX]